MKNNEISEPREILSKFLSVRSALAKPPDGKNNRACRGNLFVEVLLRGVRKYVHAQYSLVQGPLWIHGIEWIEWDGAVTNRPVGDTSTALFKPEDIVALFEIKTYGVFGGEEACRKGLENIRDNFRTARTRCPKLRHCIYLSLQERTPKNKGSVPYYQLTKQVLEPECLAIVLFQSPVENRAVSETKQYPGEWERLVDALKGL